MFGYVVINKGEMKFKDFDIYHSFYCGLCECLRKEFGIKGQMTLTYDMTFAVMLLSSLYEPYTKTDRIHCIAHPLEKHETRSNRYTEYGAKMNLLLSYYKCKDDWEDEKKASKLLAGTALKRAFRKVYKEYPEKANFINQKLRELSKEEQKQSKDLDLVAGLFGDILGEIMTPKKDEWEKELRKLGFYLGKFIYILDAYEDVWEDVEKKRYNPLISRLEDPDFHEQIRIILTMMMSECCRAFEKLPLLDYTEIMRNILYSGVWYRYEITKAKHDVSEDK